MTETNTEAGRLLTVADLKKVGDCEEQTERFRELFGAEVLVTVELAAKHASDFDWNWAAMKLLSAPARAAYEAAMAPAEAVAYIADKPRGAAQ